LLFDQSAHLLWDKHNLPTCEERNSYKCVFFDDCFVVASIGHFNYNQLYQITYNGQIISCYPFLVLASALVADTITRELSVMDTFGNVLAFNIPQVLEIPLLMKQQSQDWKDIMQLEEARLDTQLELLDLVTSNQCKQIGKYELNVFPNKKKKKFTKGGKNIPIKSLAFATKLDIIEMGSTVELLGSYFLSQSRT